MTYPHFANQVVLIAGAGGFVGSHLAEAFLEAGAKVVGVDNFITSHQSNLTACLANPNFQLQELDLNDQGQLLSMLTQVQQQWGAINIVAHFASPASPPLYQKYPTETYLVNTLATHNLLTWLKTNQPQARFLFASTSEVYGDPLEHPQKESYWGNVNPNGIRSCYDESKRLGETICGVFYRDYGMDARLIRIFNTYGPRMDLEDGRVLPQFIKQYLAGEKLTVYGDGSQTRSYCYVADLVAGIMAYLTADGLAGETINLGNPAEYTILQTAQIFNELTGRAPDELTYHPLPDDDPKKRCPDITKATKLLGWQPQVDFKQGLSIMLASYKNN